MLLLLLVNASAEALRSTESRDAPHDEPAFGAAYRRIVPDLRLTAKERTERLTDDETVKLGRLLTHLLPTDRVWFPDDTQTVAVVARDHAEVLAPGVRERVAAILGDFEESFDS